MKTEKKNTERVESYNRMSRHTSWTSAAQAGWWNAKKNWGDEWERKTLRIRYHWRIQRARIERSALFGSANVAVPPLLTVIMSWFLMKFRTTYIQCNDILLIHFNFFLKNFRMNIHPLWCRSYWYSNSFVSNGNQFPILRISIDFFFNLTSHFLFPPIHM